MGGVVDQHMDRPQGRAHRGDRRLERRHVGQVAGDERQARPQLGGQGLAAGDVEVEHPDAAALGVEGAGDGLADAAGPAGDQHGATIQIGIDGAHAGWLRERGATGGAPRSSDRAAVTSSIRCSTSSAGGVGGVRSM